MIPSDDIANRFDYHPATSDGVRKSHEATRLACHDLATFINGICPDGREKSTAVTKVEEVMFWANAAIARNN